MKRDGGCDLVRFDEVFFWEGGTGGEVKKAGLKAMDGKLYTKRVVSTDWSTSG